METTESFCTERFTVTYRIQVPTYEEAKIVADSIRIEQTIEFPYDLVQDQRIKDDIVGRIESITEVGEDGYDAIISYGVETTAWEVTQLLNVLFGNSSLQPHIWVVDIHFPPSLLAFCGGPRYGLAGLRDMLHVPIRAMIQAVIKPMGTSVQDLATMCKAYTLGGVDVIKDDHGITNQSFSRFEERVKRCAHMVHEGNAITGGHTIYAANVSGDGTDVRERAYLAKEAGAEALMVAPGLIGFGWLHALAKDPNLQLPIISHPSAMGPMVLPGISGVTRSIWMGVLPRLFGADMPIFVSYGGRFTFSKEECRTIHEHIRTPIDSIKAACPSPGGGVTAKALPTLVDLYGTDTMFLVGGDMFRRGPDLQANMQYFVELLTSLSESYLG